MKRPELLVAGTLGVLGLVAIVVLVATAPVGSAPEAQKPATTDETTTATVAAETTTAKTTTSVQTTTEATTTEPAVPIDRGGPFRTVLRNDFSDVRRLTTARVPGLHRISAYRGGLRITLPGAEYVDVPFDFARVHAAVNVRVSATELAAHGEHMFGVACLSTSGGFEAAIDARSRTFLVLSTAQESGTEAASGSTRAIRGPGRANEVALTCSMRADAGHATLWINGKQAAKARSFTATGFDRAALVVTSFGRGVDVVFDDLLVRAR